MTQIKRTPKKMRRRMKGGSDNEQLQQGESIEGKKSRLQQEGDSLAETIAGKREELYQMGDVGKGETQVKDHVQGLKGLIESGKEQKEENITALKEFKKIHKEKKEKMGEVSALVHNKKVLDDTKKVNLERAQKAKQDADKIKDTTGIICMLEIPEIKEVAFPRDPGSSEIVDQIKRFIQYKINTGIEEQGEVEDDDGGDVEDDDEDDDEGEGDDEDEVGVGGEQKEGGGLFKKRKGKKKEEKARKKAEAEKESGLELLSKMTLDILKGNINIEDKIRILQPGINTLDYFYTLQDTMEYIKEDFKNMKYLINGIKGTPGQEWTKDKVTKDDKGKPKITLNIDSEGKDEFIKTYHEIMLNGGKGEDNKELEEEVKRFKGESYVTFRSDKLSTPKTRGNNEDLQTNDETNLPEKRQYLLEFISYIYITRKNEVEQFLYYIEKIGDLLKYNIDDRDIFGPTNLMDTRWTEERLSDTKKEAEEQAQAQAQAQEKEAKKKAKKIAENKKKFDIMLQKDLSDAAAAGVYKKGETELKSTPKPLVDEKLAASWSSKAEAPAPASKAELQNTEAEAPSPAPAPLPAPASKAELQNTGAEAELQNTEAEAPAPAPSPAPSPAPVLQGELGTGGGRRRRRRRTPVKHRR